MGKKEDRTPLRQTKTISANGQEATFTSENAPDDKIFRVELECTRRQLDTFKTKKPCYIGADYAGQKDGPGAVFTAPFRAACEERDKREVAEGAET